MSKNNCVIVGASHAGVSLAMQLRREGWPEEIMLISDEIELPYHRPPLSKDFLLGKKELDQFRLRPEKAFKDNNIQLCLGNAITEIDTHSKTLLLTNDEQLQYRKLALCVGSTANEIPESKQFSNVFYLRNAADAVRLRLSFFGKKRAVVIGAGYIGLEVTACLRQQGLEVTVIDIAERILARVTSPKFSQCIQSVHEEHGVNFLLQTGVSRFDGNKEAEFVICDNGERLACDIVIIGIGIKPNISVAKKAGLKIDKGIIVNERCQTSVKDIYAAGDCTQHYNRFYDKVMTLESVQNANDQARCAASNIVGKDQSYESLPWFWSDQYDIKIQMVGLQSVDDHVVVRGDLASPKKNGLSLFYMKESRIVAVDCVNRPKEFASAKQLIQGRMTIDASTIKDESIDPFEFKNYAL